jgi:hypothetical protein
MNPYGLHVCATRLARYQAIRTVHQVQIRSKSFLPEHRARFRFISHNHQAYEPLRLPPLPKKLRPIVQARYPRCSNENRLV